MASSSSTTRTRLVVGRNIRCAQPSSFWRAILSRAPVCGSRATASCRGTWSPFVAALPNGVAVLRLGNISVWRFDEPGALSARSGAVAHPLNVLLVEDSPDDRDLVL